MAYKTFTFKLKNINKLVLNDFVRGLLVLNFDNDSLCVTCEQGKQHRQ